MTSTSPRADTRERVAAFYALETALLDDGRLREWLDLCADDICYLMPTRILKQGTAKSGGTGPGFPFFNDDKQSLTTRIARIETGLALTDSPSSVSQRIVSDVLLLSDGSAGIAVRSSFCVHLVRDEQNESTFFGRRFDVLREKADCFLILRREIHLSHYILPRAIPILL